MGSVWLSQDLSDEIIKNPSVLQHTQSIVTDIITERLNITVLVENMAGVLTNKEVEIRAKGMTFFTKILKELPKSYLNDAQIKFISKFYIDRLKDNHRVIPAVLEGYIAIVDMEKYEVRNCADFFVVLFREVACQSQVRQDRYNIYLIIQKLLDKDIDYMKAQGPDFIYGFISSMDGERDPRNLLFLFNLLPKFIRNIPLGHLVEEMFEVISCYYPIDFYPSPDDPAAVTREELATALAPCLCATHEFGEQCLVLLIEKLDSSLRMAKIDSLKLLTESCKTFNAESYNPFLRALWSSIQREISHKSDDELKMAAHQALSTLIRKLSETANSDQNFENFVKGILISMQTAIAESTTLAQYIQASKVLLTTANASKESCVIIVKAMIPAIVSYYGFKTSPKLQIASLDFLGDMFDLAKTWEVIGQIDAQVQEIPQLCLTAVSQPNKEYQIAGFKTLVRVRDVLPSELVLPFVEVLIYNVQHSQDNDLLIISVETVHAIARKYPELIMKLVVKGKCDLDNLTQDKDALQKRLNLLSNLASIDDFTKVIIEEMLKVISANDTEACKVVEALSESISNTSLFTAQKLTAIESDHGLVDSILVWLFKEIESKTTESLPHGLALVSNTISSLPAEKQEKILERHTKDTLELCKNDELYLLILESLYKSIHQSVHNSMMPEILNISLKLALNSENEDVRMKSCILIAHFLNKAEFGEKFEVLIELLKNYLSSCSKDNQELCTKLIILYGWITKALIVRGSDIFMFWLQKIMVALLSPEYCHQASEAIKLIMSDSSDYLNSRHHCRISLLYKQRMFQSFSGLCDKLTVQDDTKEAYLLSWAYVLGKAPKNVLNDQVKKIVPLVIDSLEYDNKNLLLVMTTVLCHFVQAKHVVVAQSLQTILPRLVKLSKYVNSMDVRIKSLQCLHDIACAYATLLLLPFKQDVLLDLAPSLDDKKRLVRNMAVRARTRWFMIGAPGESKEN